MHIQLRKHGDIHKNYIFVLYRIKKKKLTYIYIFCLFTEFTENLRGGWGLSTFQIKLYNLKIFITIIIIIINNII